MIVKIKIWINNLIWKLIIFVTECIAEELQ